MPRSKANAKQSEKGKPLEAAKKNLASQKIARKSAPVTTGVKDPVKKRRARPGQAALREIKKYQKTAELLIQRAPFQRRSKFLLNSVRQIADQFAKASTGELNNPDRSGGFRFQPQALDAIQEAVETSIVSLYEDAYLCTIHAKRMTLFDQDVILARRIRGDAFWMIWLTIFFLANDF